MATSTFAHLLSSIQVQCCFTSIQTTRTIRDRGAQDGHLDFHTAPELWGMDSSSSSAPFFKTQCQHWCRFLLWDSRRKYNFELQKVITIVANQNTEELTEEGPVLVTVAEDGTELPVETQMVGEAEGGGVYLTMIKRTSVGRFSEAGLLE